MRILELFPSVAALAGLLACAANDAGTDQRLVRNELRRDLLGCYDLLTARGTPITEAGFTNAATPVRLDSTPLGSSAVDVYPGIFRALRYWPGPLASDSLGLLHYSWWADSLSDSISLSLGDGFTGTTLVLSALAGDHDTLLGRAEEFGDVVLVNDSNLTMATARGPVRAVRITCPD